MEGVDLDKYHQFICELNYYHDFIEDFSALVNKDPEDDTNYTAEDTAENKEKIVQEKVAPLKAVNVTYDSPDHYIDVWQPLFFLETKAQISKSQKNEGEQPELVTIDIVKKGNPFQFITVIRKASENTGKYTNQDLVLLSKDYVKTSSPALSLSFFPLFLPLKPEKTQQTHFIGILEQVDFQKMKLKILVIQNEKDPRFNQPQPESLWYIQKLCGLSTLNREYQALHSIRNLFLRKALLNPKETAKNGDEFFSIPAALEQRLKLDFNDSQLEAMRNSLKKKGITLIQGPPGTGKTTTILGVLSVLLNSHEERVSLLKKLEISPSANHASATLAKVRKAMPWLYDSKYTEGWDEEIKEETVSQGYYKSIFKVNTVELPTIKVDTTQSSKPEKILICAPSNAAIDEIIRKIMSLGIFDNEGSLYKPQLIRIGPNYHPSLKEVALEYLVNQELAMRNLKASESDMVQSELLRKCNIVCSTLSVTGSVFLVNLGQEFDTVIVDEAAQTVEISSLIPLKYGCKRLILIGDPSQLPATIFSKVAQAKKYDLSLFQRLQQSDFPVHMLDVHFLLDDTKKQTPFL